MARLVAHNAVPGQKIDVKLDPEAYPFTVQIHGRTEKLFPEKYLEGSEVRAKSQFTVPEDLKPGEYPILLRDRNGPRQIGIVKIPAWTAT